MRRPPFLSLLKAKSNLNLIAISDLPSLASEEMANNDDFEPEISQLASIDLNDFWQTRSTFDEICRDAGLDKMTIEDSLNILVDNVCHEILSSKVSPQVGSKMIWDAALNADNYKKHDLDGFIYGASEYASRPKESKLFDAGIIKQAKKWLVDRKKAIE